MKKLILTLMLVIMGQRWESLEQGFVSHQWCSQDTVQQCSEPFRITQYYRLVYVLGETVRTDTHMMMCHVSPCYEDKERFTIPVPKTPSKQMTAEEAEQANKGLMR